MELTWTFTATRTCWLHERAIANCRKASVIALHRSTGSNARTTFDFCKSALTIARSWRQHVFTAVNVHVTNVLLENHHTAHEVRVEITVFGHRLYQTVIHLFLCSIHPRPQLRYKSMNPPSRCLRGPHRLLLIFYFRISDILIHK